MQQQQQKQQQQQATSTGTTRAGVFPVTTTTPTTTTSDQNETTNPPKNRNNNRAWIEKEEEEDDDTDTDDTDRSILHSENYIDSCIDTRSSSCSSQFADADDQDDDDEDDDRATAAMVLMDHATTSFYDGAVHCDNVQTETNQTQNQLLSVLVVPSDTCASSSSCTSSNMIRNHSTTNETSSIRMTRKTLLQRRKKEVIRHCAMKHIQNILSKQNKLLMQQEQEMAMTQHNIDQCRIDMEMTRARINAIHAVPSYSTTITTQTQGKILDTLLSERVATLIETRKALHLLVLSSSSSSSSTTTTTTTKTDTTSTASITT
jgi:hypothetical protein